MNIQNRIKEIILNSNPSQILFKPIPLPPNTLSKYIAAFANTSGGYIVFGVISEDTEINIVGLSDDFYSKKIIETALDMLNPKPILRTEIITSDNKKILILDISISQQTIYCNSNKYAIEDDILIKCKEVPEMDKTKVFIVHGHDNEAKQETARFVESLGLKAIILHEQASSGSTIIEKIEAYSNVGYAIVLYTPCDLGKAKEDKDLKPRARQNVVFEHGYLMAKIGRKNVCALVKSNVEKPNDISGVVYVDMDNAGAWKYTIVKEMKSVGYDIDVNTLFD